MAEPLTIRDLRDDERAWADERYRAIRFATTPPGSVALVAERAGVRVGFGRLVVYPGGVIELGGIWTDEAARGAGVARAMVSALLARAARAVPGERPEAGPQAGVEGSSGLVWCIPFAHLAAFYQSCGFAPVAPPWPPPIAGKVAECIAHALPDVVVLAR
jgi:GNAT superfamily N-acetyltransferase